jgi:uncharacterized membrane protein YjjP (DUF1212 family)
MAEDRQTALTEFKRSMRWIVIVAVVMVVGALSYLQQADTLTPTTIIATTCGVFFSVLLGSGLFALAFFSDKSGLDQQVTDVTQSERDHAHPQIPNRETIS